MKGTILNRYTAASKNLGRYFNDISKYELLDPNEELELVIKAKAGDMKAKTKLINANLRFVISIAKTYTIKTAMLEDLVAEGNKGMVEAIDGFDHTRGFKFISYAVWYIRKNIIDFLASSKTIKLPGKVTYELYKYDNFVRSFNNEFYRNPTHAEFLTFLADNDLKFAKTSIDIIKNSKPVAVPLDASNTMDENSYNPIDYIHSPDFAPDFALQKSEATLSIYKLLNSLEPTEKELLLLYYGLTQYGILTYIEIGEKYEKTPEWVRKKIKRAERRLKVRVKSMGLRRYDLIT